MHTPSTPNSHGDNKSSRWLQRHNTWDADCPVQSDGAEAVSAPCCFSLDCERRVEASCTGLSYYMGLTESGPKCPIGHRAGPSTWTRPRGIPKLSWKRAFHCGRGPSRTDWAKWAIYRSIALLESGSSSAPMTLPRTVAVTPLHLFATPEQ